jgi:hypothetical protein
MDIPMQNKDQTVIDFIDYRRERYAEQNRQQTSPSDDLSKEIRILINRLREHRPLKHTG